MANVCDFCGKKRDVGHNVSHAKNRTRRLRKPNLHSHRMRFEATTKTEATSIKLKLCTKCLRSIKSASRPVVSAKEAPAVAA